MFKKALSLLLSLMLIVTSLSVTILSVSAADDGTQYVVAGDEALCGVNWKPTVADAPDNVMTDKGDGTYEKVYTDVAPAKYSVKIGENYADGTYAWIGADGTEDNYVFNVTDVCDVTITYNPATKSISASGDGVEIPTDLKIDSITAVGEGNGTFLNGLKWKTDAAENHMTEVSKGVYEISYQDVADDEIYQFKFAANDSWADSWGYGANGSSEPYLGSGVVTDAVYNGGNITFEIPAGFGLADVKLSLDLTNFDYPSKSGAKFTVTLTESGDETDTTVATEATEETTEATEATEETTEATEATTEATEATTADGLTVTGTSNFFPKTVQHFDKDTKQVTVTYFMTTTKDVLDFQWYLTFDPAVLKYNEEANIKADGSYYNVVPWLNGMGGDQINVLPENTSVGRIDGNCTSTTLFALPDGTRFPFISVTFDVIGEGNTTVDLYVDTLELSLRKGFQSDPEQEEKILDDGIIFPTSTQIDLETVVYAGGFNPDATIPVETTEATETTQATEATETTQATEATETTQATEATQDTEATSGNDSVYVVAGDEAFCGVNWIGKADEAPGNVMTESNGVYTKVFTVTEPLSKVGIKVVENAADGTLTWFGDETGNNYIFNVTQPCDVTVTFDPVTSEITVAGDFVERVSEIEINSITAAGQGSGEGCTFLNGLNWKQDAAENHMTEVSDKVYEITYKNVDEFENYQVKFVANDAWTDSWGYGANGSAEVFPGSGVAFDAVYNGGNIVFSVPYAFADVTLRLDLTQFNYATKTGAVITITVTEAENPGTTVADTTVADTTVADTTAADTTVADTTAADTTVADTTVADTTAADTTVADTTVADTTGADTTVPTASQGATSATGSTVNGGSTSDTTNGGNGAVQTGNASMALVILLVLVSACGAMYFARKRVK